jgi:hypothetical protein
VRPAELQALTHLFNDRVVLVQGVGTASPRKQLKTFSAHADLETLWPHGGPDVGAHRGRQSNVVDPAHHFVAVVPDEPRRTEIEDRALLVEAL